MIMEKYIFDIVVLAVMVLIVVASAKKGFAKTVLDAVSVAVGFFTAYKFSSVVSDFIYNTFIRGIVEKSFLKMTESMAVDSSAEDKLTAMVDALPEGVVNFSQNIGVDIDVLIQNVLQADTSTDELLATAVADKLVYGVIDFILEFIVFVLIFAVVSCVLKLVSSLFSKTVEKLPLVGKANYILGGVLGAVKAVVALFVVCSVLYLIMTVTNGEPPEFISESYTYQYIIKNNPIIVLIQG